MIITYNESTILVRKEKRKRSKNVGISYELFRMDESVNGALKRFLERRLKLI